MTQSSSLEALAGLREPWVVTIDGEAATGKSSLGVQLARSLGAAFLDTGAMYRDATALGLEHGVDLGDQVGLVELVMRRRAGHCYERVGPAWALDEAFDRRLRAGPVAERVAVVAKHPALRGLMVGWQRAVAARCPRLVSEGRDQGSVVFPGAVAKFYLIADLDDQVQRRAKQLRESGHEVDLGQLRAALAERNEIDRNNALKQGEGAVTVDTRGRPAASVLEELQKLVLMAAGKREGEGGGEGGGEA